jgi:hypothetical protein
VGANAPTLVGCAACITASRLLETEDSRRESENMRRHARGAWHDCSPPVVTKEVYSVKLSLQRKLELAGELAKVQPLLLRLHLIEKPRKRRPVRSLIVAGSVIAFGAVLAAAVLGRRCCRTSAPGDIQGFAQTVPDAEPPEAASGLETADQQSGEIP